MSDVAGDGTTTATVLAQSIVNEGLKMVAAGATPMISEEIGRRLDSATGADRQGRKAPNHISAATVSARVEG